MTSLLSKRSFIIPGELCLCTRIMSIFLHFEGVWCRQGSTNQIAAWQENQGPMHLCRQRCNNHCSPNCWRPVGVQGVQNSMRREHWYSFFHLLPPPPKTFGGLLSILLQHVHVESRGWWTKFVENSATCCFGALRYEHCADCYECIHGRVNDVEGNRRMERILLQGRLPEQSIEALPRSYRRKALRENKKYKTSKPRGCTCKQTVNALINAVHSREVWIQSWPST